MDDLALITGGEGFLGRATRAAFAEAGLRTYGIGRRSGGVEPYSSIDLRDEAAISDLGRILATERPRWLIHLAGAPGDASFRDNVEPVRTVLAALEGSGPRVRLLAVGSAAEYGDQGPCFIAETFPDAPVTEYGVAKLAATQLVLLARRRGLDASVARVFNLLGPGMRGNLAPATFVQRLLESDSDLVARNSEAVRDYLAVDEAARALTALARHPQQLPPIVNVCSGVATRMRELFGELAAQSGLARGREIASDGQSGPLPVSIGDPRLFERVCGWRPTFSLENAVRSMLSNLRRGS